jgi:hypothetical protein
MPLAGQHLLLSLTKTVSNSEPQVEIEMVWLCGGV